MPKALILEKLRPRDIVEVKMDSNRILHIQYLYPILDSDMDYKVAKYVEAEVAKLEKTHGRAMGLFVDLNRYNRLDGREQFGLSLPSLKTRQLNTKMYKESSIKRVAFYKKNVSKIAMAVVNMVAIYHRTKTNFFDDPKKAIKWLEEGVIKHHA